VSADELSDAVLARRAADGDERAFAELVRRHKEPLYRLLRRYVGNADDAYEAAHEAFIAAWAAIGRYDSKRPFLAWLRTIAINKARDRGRRMALRRLLFGSGSFEESGAFVQIDPATPADDELIQRQDMAVLDQAIARLPAPLKEALLLTAFDGWSQQEAGQILGVSIKTIETRAYRARKILERTIDPNLKPKR
jgi:RNA polymerase sigma factor (sigma-70 family)